MVKIDGRIVILIRMIMPITSFRNLCKFYLLGGRVLANYVFEDPDFKAIGTQQEMHLVLVEMSCLVKKKTNISN